MQNVKDIWKKIVSNVRSRISDPAVYDSLIVKTRELVLNENCLTIEVGSDFIKQKLDEQYKPMFVEELSGILKTQSKIKVLIPAEGESFDDNVDLLDETHSIRHQVKNRSEVRHEKAQMPKVEDDLEKIQRQHEQSEVKSNVGGLYPNYTFDNFVVGNSNKFAHGASIAVANHPGKQYNPLFLHGGVGLGKTHLMQAIGHYVLKSNKKAKVIYVTSEFFLNEMVNAMQNHTEAKFREKYRSADVLMVDDIQFISGKVGTQEEFFHTFNQLFQSSKQIVLTSDKPPQEIRGLEERLVSRFVSGMVADIHPPDFELRLAILNKARDTSGKQIPNEMMAYIAQKIEGSIRRLEGAFIKVVAFAEMTKREITENLVDEALYDISQTIPKKITIDNVVKVVADYYRIGINDFKAKNRSGNVAFPRQVAMYLCKSLVDASTTKIGSEFGGRDHSTVIYGIQKIEEKMEGDPAFSNEIEGLIQKIKKTS